ncbi:MAG: Dam family site-specific DNA-(adenine-N6)-methyltransferase [Acidobacteriota bacterium]|nr:Dam family site-specific DNA-(adenine-N6)-methyltransferase [Acidobacteriota bacterium]
MQGVQAQDKAIAQPPKPLLKWAGGKTQLLDAILPKFPSRYGKFIEPFVGGGAVFFALAPQDAVIGDSNPELINLYRCVASDVEAVVAILRSFDNTEDFFYHIRSLDFTQLEPARAAARTIYLNKTCFNGLFRVNRRGQFNVPFGRHANPNFLDAANLRAASELLKKAKIECLDYKTLLANEAREGDLIFLDPPYLPTSEHSDFKRYTKEQFYEEDHVELAAEVQRLKHLGCHIVLTNSNHPLVHELYAGNTLDVVQTKRYINCRGGSRRGEDVIVSIKPVKRPDFKLVPKPLPTQVSLYPSTRYMGSKHKLLAEIWMVASQFQFETVLDLFSGSGIVGYMFKAQGKQVISNDYMAMGAIYSKALIENSSMRLNEKDVQRLLVSADGMDTFVQTRFKGLYYPDEDNLFIDQIRHNLKQLHPPSKRALAMAALIRACLKKRPRGIFTYVGHRYDDGRRDLAASIQEQFLSAVATVNAAVFDNGRKNKSQNLDALEVKAVEGGMVYIDPPYYSPLSDNEYVRRYHFVEGLARDWKGVEIQEHTLTKKFKSYPTPFSSRKGAHEAFDALFRKHKNNYLLVSYSSNSQPTLDEMVNLLAKYKAHVEVVPIDYKYSFGTQNHKIGNKNNSVQEYLFIGY